MDSTKKELITFLILLTLLTIISYIPIIMINIPHAENSIYAIGVVFSPCLAALITKLIFHKNLRELGWKWGKTKYQIISYFLPILYGLILYFIVWISISGSLNKQYLNEFILTKDVFLNFTIFATFGVLVRGIGAFGEEIGFRGYLVPQLSKITSFTKTCFISGVIWSIWHYPMIFLTDYGTKNLSGIIFATIVMISASFILAWLRIKSGSIWTVIIFHASHNKFIQNLFDPLTTDKGHAKFITGEFGVGLAIILLIIAFIFWLYRSYLPLSCNNKSLLKSKLKNNS